MRKPEAFVQQALDILDRGRDRQDLFIRVCFCYRSPLRGEGSPDFRESLRQLREGAALIERNLGKHLKHPQLSVDDIEEHPAQCAIRRADDFRMR